jgi:site-specific DNA-methyltransferase (adenine-specific)
VPLPRVLPLSLATTTSNVLYAGAALDLLAAIPPASVQLVYIDPPFNTGTTQTRTTRQSSHDPSGTLGFAGQRYAHTASSTLSYADSYADYEAFLLPHLIAAHQILASTGTLYLHLDYREVHYAKIALDRIFGRSCFLNEIIWAYDYGARTRRRWPAKHDNILVYVKDPASYYFDSTEVDREPYMAPGLVTPAKAALGKLPTDVWWHTIVSPTGKEKTGYPTQKPSGILRRIIAASSAPGDTVVDCFAGSGTTAAVAAQLNRRFITGDSNPAALSVLRARLAPYAPIEYRPAAHRVQL